jgi:hypothetical protein
MTLEPGAAFDQENEVVGHLLELGREVRAQDHGGPAGAGLDDPVLQLPARDRVEAGSRLVEDQEVGTEEEGERRIQLLSRATRKGGDPLIERRGPREPVEQRLIHRTGIATELAHHPHQLPPGELFREPRRLRHVADASAILRGPVERVTENAHLPFVGGDEAEEDLDERGLAGAVGTGEPGDLPGGEGRLEPVEHRAPAEPLGDGMQ